MRAEEARAQAAAHDAHKAQAQEIEAARAYRKHRPLIDAKVAERAKQGFTDAITDRPLHEAADLLEMRLRKRGYRVRRMRHGPYFLIEWGAGQ